VCKDSVVRVTQLVVLCDSPYTFYYGNGAHRNSITCNYGDKLSMQVQFQVVDDIQQDNYVYVSMGIYDNQNNLLLTVDPADLCRDYVGTQCTLAGYYSFSTRVRLPYPNEAVTSNDMFSPQVHMAFSTNKDSGYNLGAVNIECAAWDPNDPSYAPWTRRTRRPPFQTFVIQYGMLVATGCFLLALGSFIWQHASISDLIEQCGAADMVMTPSKFMEIT
jgi:hypothetical protein